MIKTELKLDKLDNDILLKYYAYADDKKKTWFICPVRRKIYSGLILLFVLGCKDSIEPLHKIDNYPCVGTVLCDINGRKLKVIHCEWV